MSDEAFTITAPFFFGSIACSQFLQCRNIGGAELYTTHHLVDADRPNMRPLSSGDIAFIREREKSS